MARTTQFDVPVATQRPVPQKTYSGTLDECTPDIGDVPHECPARNATSAKFLNSAGYCYYNVPIAWKQNWTFRAGLKFDHLGAQNSSVCVYLKDQQTGKRYQIHPDVFREMMQKTTWVYGVAMEDWTWEKRGRYIFLCPTYIK